MRQEEKINEHIRIAEQLSQDSGRPDSEFMSIYANALKWAMEKEPNDKVKNMQSWIEAYPQ